MVRCASEAIGLANTIRELGHEAHVCVNSGQTLQQHAGWLSAAGAAPSNTWRQSTFGCSRKEKNQELRIEKTQARSTPLTDDEPSGWKTFGDVV